MKERTEVPVEQTWDLSFIIQNRKRIIKNLSNFYKQLVENFCKTFENQSTL